MKKAIRLLVVLAAAVAVVFAALGAVKEASRGIDSIDQILALPDGRTLVAQNNEDKLELAVIDSRGRTENSLSLGRIQDGRMVLLEDMSADAEGYVYLLKTLCDPATGQPLGQQLDCYDLGKWLGKRLSRVELDMSDVTWRFIECSNAVVLMGTDRNESMLTRISYDRDMLIDADSLSPLGERSYRLDAAEGTYDAVSVESGVAVMTRSGKVFYAAGEGQLAEEIYPARVLTEVMYPTSIAAANGASVLISEQESGDISLLDLESGKTEPLKQGGEPFSGVSSYSPKDIIVMSALDVNNFTAVAKNFNTAGYELIVCETGEIAVVDNIGRSVASIVLGAVGRALLYFLALAALYLIVTLSIGGLLRSRTILAKLNFTAIPLFAVALVIFGLITFGIYCDSVEETFEKQISDEGNMLSALFGYESFEEIEYPYDYSGEAYSYLKQQMATRKVFVSSAYYEGFSLYTGVDASMPCFYTLDYLMDSGTVALYESAALSGTAQTAVLHDSRGSRLSCVTPIGGLSGDTVYLLETGIYLENINSYTRDFARNYIIIAAVSLVAIALLLRLIFRRALAPLGIIRSGLEEFSSGNRKKRIECGTDDELADICRVFNKLADDIDLQIFNLNRNNETYYKFVPLQMLRFLKEDNLGSIDIGSHVEGRYAVLCASLALAGDCPAELARETTNSFFGVFQSVCEERADDAALINDRANLRSLRIICPAGAAQAIEIALSAMVSIDSLNASLPLRERMEVSMVAHRAELYFGICGERTRLIPTLISSELDWIVGQERYFKELSSRLIVTSSMTEQLDMKRYFSRYIGTAKDAPIDNLGLYDFYDGAPAETASLINATASEFAKAMELYESGRYYDAKSLFVLVLRQNKFDNVTRHFLFECEKHL